MTNLAIIEKSNPDGYCKKCGDNSIDVYYRESCTSKELNPFGFPPISEEELRHKAYFCNVKTEHLHKICNMCGYRWIEQTIDIK